MTAGDVLLCVWRRWYVALSGLLLTAIVGTLLAPGQHAYSARASVVFVAPGRVATGQTDDAVTPFLISFAAMVRLAMYSHDEGAMEPASFGGSLVGAGVTKGYDVVLPNSGGQWSQYYSEPVLSVEAVDSSPSAAADQVGSLMRQIDRTTADLQERLHIPVEGWVTTTAGSAEVAVVDGGITSSTRVRGLLALAVVGGFLSAVAAVVTDRLVLARARRRESRKAVDSLIQFIAGGP